MLDEDMGIVVVLDGQPRSRDIAGLVAPDGQVLSTYDKGASVARYGRSSANAVFRAVENGYTLVRQTSNGIAITVDAYGANLARTSYFSTWTVDGVVGDLFAWLCVASVIGLVTSAAVRRTGHRD